MNKRMKDEWKKREVDGLVEFPARIDASSRHRIQIFANAASLPPSFLTRTLRFSGGERQREQEEGCSPSRSFGPQLCSAFFFQLLLA